MSKEDEPTGMQKRRITLHDQRYMIFYTFEDEPPVPPAAAEKETETKRRGPTDAVPQAEEERRV
jgi:hypothetical protein